jgi:hypothetical protein
VFLPRNIFGKQPKDSNSKELQLGIDKGCFFKIWEINSNQKKPSEGLYDNQKLVVVANDMKFAHHLIEL